MRKEKAVSENYLERRPKRKEQIQWSKDEDGIVTLHIVNSGFFHWIAQKFFKRPKISHVHLDEMGSFVWPLLDGEKDIIALGKLVKEHFGDKAEPLYERLAKYFQILESYTFIQWEK